MILYILRGVFILLVAAVTALYVLPFQQHRQVDFNDVVLMMVLALGVSLVIIAADVLSPRKKLSALSGVFLGLIGGLVAAYALSFVVDLIWLILFETKDPAKSEHYQATSNLFQGIKVLIGLITSYVGISLVLQTKDDFRFVLPYVEFAKELRGQLPTLVDTSVIIDGRILDIVSTQFVQGPLIIPRFVLDELHAISDSADKLKRARGRRGLEILQKLQSDAQADITMDDTEVHGASVDQKLMNLALQIKARVMTNDFNMSKIAELRGVEVLNLNELAKAMRPVVLPGEMMRIKIVKPGENPVQGVGYLEDGTMVVVEHARQMIGQEIDLVVTSMLQTSAGRMIFGKLAGKGPGGEESKPGPGPAPNGGKAPPPPPSGPNRNKN